MTLAPSHKRHGLNAGQPYGATLPFIAAEILRLLSDGEWHEVGHWNHKTVRRLETSKLIYVGSNAEGRLLAIATDAGLARIKPRVLPVITEAPTHPMVRT
jgi:hypothetical protein